MKQLFLLIGILLCPANLLAESLDKGQELTIILMSHGILPNYNDQGWRIDRDKELKGLEFIVKNGKDYYRFGEQQKGHDYGIEVSSYTSPAPGLPISHNAKIREAMHFSIEPEHRELRRLILQLIQNFKTSGNPSFTDLSFPLSYILDHSSISEEVRYSLKEEASFFRGMLILSSLVWLAFPISAASQKPGTRQFLSNCIEFLKSLP
jgi:hypothetical protein